MWKIILVIGALIVVVAYVARWFVGSSSSSAENAAVLVFVGVVVLAVGLVAGAVDFVRRHFGKTQ
jgi:TRAP-type C4-dicarboxylate transport system permease small subunit